jgi:hypothetical protein
MIGSLLGMAARATVRTGAMALTAGAAAATVGMAGAFAANRLYHSTLGRRGTIGWHQTQIPGTKIPFVPIPQFTRTFTNTLTAGAMGAAVGLGANDYFQRRRWNLDQALSTGMVEVERDDFLGATGSLTIASHRNRHGSGTSPAYAGILSNRTGAYVNLIDDAAIMASRVVR